MDYEKKYKEALEKAQRFYNNSVAITKKGLEDIFPELKESEDERIRQLLIRFVTYDMSDNYSDDFTPADCIAWLEKQGEQNPTDKVEPKFKVGDWIITPENKVLQITSIEGTSYKFNNESHYWEICYCDEKCRLWTIQDAKDGDVLASEDKDKVFIYNGKLDLKGRVCAYCGIYKTYDGLRFTECAIGNYFTYKEPHPATKEQRDALVKAMTNAGYTFDFEKKELKKIETNLLTVQRAKEISPFMKSGFDSESAAWSEEDEKILSTIIKEGDLKPSERQWLKSLKDRVQPKQEWSEEEEENFKKAIRVLKVNNFHHTADMLQEMKYKLIPREKANWKPSDEQMKTLQEVIDVGYFTSYPNSLETLYEQLKKLKGE